MPRALMRIAGTLLALAAVVPAPLASAQFFARPLRGQMMPMRRNRSEGSVIFSQEQQRLAEMKVELALLSDIATFPYEIRAHANGPTLVLRGSVPNEMVRQRAMDLVRRNTVLRAIDELSIQPNLSVRTPLRQPQTVQQEGSALLQKELGEPAKQISLDARPNGVVVLAGHTDSVQSKLEIGRLFRSVPGCSAVINELVIEPVLHDGQRVALVTRDSSLFVSPSTLALALAPSAPDPAAIPSPPGPGSNIVAMPGRPVEERVGSGWEAFAPSRLPVKWSRPSSNWEGQAKELEAAQAQAVSPPPHIADPYVQAPPQPSPKPDDSAWSSHPVQSRDQMPTPIRPIETNKAQGAAAAVKRARAGAASHPNFAESRETSAEPSMTWRPPGGHEESEPKTAPAAKAPQTPVSEPLPPPSDARLLENPPPPVPPSLRSPRRWPPAYVTGPPPNQGRPGVILFDDDPQPPPARPAPAVIATTRSPVPANLQRQIKLLCGQQAREVIVAAQHDGSVLVRVKVANRTVENQLSQKILALPEMNSPQVRLLMEIEP